MITRVIDPVILDQFANSKLVIDRINGLSSYHRWRAEPLASQEELKSQRFIVLHDDNSNRFGAFELVLGKAKRDLSTRAHADLRKLQRDGCTEANGYDGLLLDIDDEANTKFVWAALQHMIIEELAQTFTLYSRDRNAGTKYGAVPEPLLPVDPKTGRRKLVLPGVNGLWNSSRLNRSDFMKARLEYSSGKSVREIF